MSVVKRYPFRDIMYLQEKMNRVFEESLQDRSAYNTAGEWVPHVDIYEDDTSITLKAEIPGVNREDVHLDISNGVLSISGKKRFAHEDRNESYHIIERQYGTFKRSFTIPEIVESDKIDARCENGVLEVFLPKSEQSVTRKIPITEG